MLIKNNNLYQGLIQTKIILIPIIRNTRPIKDNEKVIEQQPHTSQNVIKSGGIFLMLRDDEMGKHIRPIKINQDRKRF